MKSIDWQKNDGLVPAIVQDADTSRVLMLAYMNQESLEITEKTKKVTFYSRSRKALWTKGETSKNYLEYVSMKIDCDGDTLLVQARPLGPVCHEGTDTCFGDEKNSNLTFLNQLTATIGSRFEEPDQEKSYVAKLVASGLDKIAQKVGEEAVETVIAAKNSNQSEFEGEAADLLFHLMVLLRAKNSSLDNVAAVLKARHKK
jgi:phosphoribosyl-ATP pyrophosphohydrolase/phosphoribosyl-AMP cyclohydrolase